MDRRYATTSALHKQSVLRLHIPHHVHAQYASTEILRTEQWEWDTQADMTTNVCALESAYSTTYTCKEHRQGQLKAHLTLTLNDAQLLYLAGCRLDSLQGCH